MFPRQNTDKLNNKLIFSCILFFLFILYNICEGNCFLYIVRFEKKYFFNNNCNDNNVILRG